ncbi:Putative HORMA domain, Zinc finger, FYVE/PHD-type, Zinc finger, RING/FYVE/PHD-type [Septoria linicola]|uniref:HORMA domain, Zinc finger, FYVE/PHD-type, Zinc finger, RING/FYVE/PHD-type n=1 Tax=Septoria linicola TaxID=215465 RepID=A0A9Q9EHX4_9PEZI|nr:putative HORMA domain, Zinc finger, FYVE/PHD-type, Zinc finger, RING/FYVE/PHD-type [Septoria linicola]USW52246.1 Putative HORMA domain, Zinc finger, FYVE/PHD-type, Zinc finger, RING/FYVE/PHD-type [Septoria linicola]
MATKQIQKTCTTQTKTKTTITQKQSLEVVQTLLHGGLSSLAYLRMFFAEKAFDTQTYSAGNRMPSYQDYVNGKLPKQKKTETGTHTVMKVLRRTRSKRADAFLDWLEEGAFVALREGRLRALQIYVHTDPDHRDRVVETYTFTIKYHDDGRGGRLLAGLEFDSPGKEGFTVEATTRALQDMLLRIIDTCQGLPDLPEQRFISMALFYPEDSNDIKLRGFEASTIEQLLFAQAEGWEKNTLKFDEVQSAFHSASLRVTHLEHPVFRGLSSIAEPARIPSRLEYVPDQSRESEIVDMLESPAAVSSEKTPTTLGRTPSTVFPEETTAADPETFVATPAPTSTLPAQVDEEDEQRIEETVPMQNSRVTSLILPESIDTQASDAPRMKSALQHMLRPEHISQGDTQTQALGQASKGIEATPSVHNRFATPLIRASASVKLLLLPEVLGRLKERKSELRLKALKLAGVTVAKAKKIDVVLCQCGHAEEEDDMINCSFCGTWQHLHCYGFTGTDDPRLPDDHACFQCLLGGHDDTLLVNLREVALKRRAMSFALQHGLQRNREDLAKSMGVSVSVAKGLIGHLLKEGFVLSPTASRGSALSGLKKPHYVPIHEGPALDKLQRELFDPLTHIGQFYANTTSLSTTITRQLRALRSASMPPPATPNSPIPERGVHFSPSSRIIERPVTPSRTLEKHRQPLLKRPLDEDIFSTPAKRRATATPVFHRFRSVQTVGVLNADGLSSPAS